MKQALLQLARKVAYIDGNGQTYYNALYSAFYDSAPVVVLDSISAVFNQGSATIYDTDALDSLKQYLTVTANYSDSTTATVPSADYTLSGTLAEGISTITVSYDGKTTTFNVTVFERDIPAEYQKVEYIGATGGYDFATTGITMGISDTIEIQMALMATGNQPNTYGYPIGVARDTTSQSVGFGVNVNQGLTDVATFGGTLVSIQPNNGNSILNQKIDIVAVRTPTGSSITDGTHSNSVEYTPRETSGNLRFFGVPANTTHLFPFKGNIYYVKITKNGTLAGDFVACKRIDTGIGGFYDKVSGSFKSDSDFIVGPDV
jgi:hypothetical protein